MSMALTENVKTELATVVETTPSARIAELASMIRLAGQLLYVDKQPYLEVELDHPQVARRMVSELGALFNAHCDVNTVGSARNSGRSQTRYIIRIVHNCVDLLRRLGLLDPHKNIVRGLPPAVVSGSKADAIAAWRGAFMAHGTLSEPGRSNALELTAPAPEAALALVGAARRFGVTVKSKEIRSADRVIAREGEAIGILLDTIGAVNVAKEWEAERSHREVRASANRLANFDDANLRRSAQAAVSAAAKAERALEILGDDVPDHLLAAGQLRIQHRQSSLEELGQLAKPSLTKDAIAGRIRRLLSMADRKAAQLGIPGTSSVVADDYLS